MRLLGESDEDRYEGFTFGGGKDTGRKIPKRNKALGRTLDDGKFQSFDLNEGSVDAGGEVSAESDGFAEDAMDLAAVLDDGSLGDDDDVSNSEKNSDSEEDDLLLLSSDDEEDAKEKEKLASLQMKVSTMTEQKPRLREHSQA